MASSVDAKLLRQTKFPPEFNRKVDMTKVNIEVMKKWIAKRISEILGNEDDVVIEMCFGHLEGPRYPDIKSLQIQLTGFLDKDTPKFCQELWSLCLSGQANPQGVPKELLEAKKLELIQEKLDAEKAAEASRRQKEQEQTRERDIDNIRRQERSDRGRFGGRGGGRGGRDFNRRSPPPRDRDHDRYREAGPRRDFDSYVPHDNRRGRRSSGTSAKSRSRSPQHSPTGRGRDAPRQRPRERRRSPSYSASPDRRRRGGPRRRSPDYGDRARSITRSHASRSRSPRGDRRRRDASRSRSPSRSHRPGRPNRNRDRDPRRLSRSRSRSNSRDRRRDNRRRRSPSGSRSRSPRRDMKRRRSMDRYNPAERSQRSKSPLSSPDEKRHKKADEDEESTRRPSKADDQDMKDADENIDKPISNLLSSTEFREKLLRERILAMRHPSDKVSSSSTTDKQ